MADNQHDDSDAILQKFFWIIAASIVAYALAVIVYVL
jgi:hypothetical protein